MSVMTVVKCPLNICKKLRIKYSTSGLPKTAPSKTCKNKKLPALCIASWNVRRMTAGLANDLQQIDAACKTAIIYAELHRLDTDIAALQETRLADNGSLTEMHYTFFWQGKTGQQMWTWSQFCCQELSIINDWTFNWRLRKNPHSLTINKLRACQHSDCLYSYIVLESCCEGPVLKRSRSHQRNAYTKWTYLFTWWL